MQACQSIQKFYTYYTIVLEICRCYSLLIFSSVATLLYTLLTLNDTSNSVFFSLYTLNTLLQRYDSTCVVDFCFHTSKCILNRKLYFSIKYVILSATSDSSAFSNVRRREISLQLLTIVQSFYFDFCSSTIFVIFYSYSTLLVSSDLVKSNVISSLSINYNSLYTLASRLSLSKALLEFALNTTALTLYLVISFYIS